jgi:hypothetical protein
MTGAGATGGFLIYCLPQPCSPAQELSLTSALLPRCPAQDAAVIHEVKQWLAGQRAQVGVLAKIESADSVKHLEEILDAVDGAMVARGDLGAELPLEEVPYWQSRIVQGCRWAAAGGQCVAADCCNVWRLIAAVQRLPLGCLGGVDSWLVPALSPSAAALLRRFDAAVAQSGELNLTYSVLMRSACGTQAGRGPLPHQCLHAALQRLELPAVLCLQAARQASDRGHQHARVHGHQCSAHTRRGV